MSEVENSTTDIDNNVQTPSKTPKKRMSRAEKARIESEELLKSLGVTIESGRQTRSTRRGTTAVESPKPEPTKRKQTNTPRSSKKAKIAEADQTDSTNHVNESGKKDAQADGELPQTSSNVPDKVSEPHADEEAPAAETSIVPNNVNSEEKMEIDTPADSKDAEIEPQPQSESVPLPEESQSVANEAAESTPIAEQIIDSIPVSQTIESVPAVSQSEESQPNEESLPASSQVEITPPKTIEEPEVLQNDDAPIAADTTTIVIDSEPASSQNNNVDTAPIEIDLQESFVNNSQAEPVAIVDLESSSNEGDPKIEAAHVNEARDSLDLEIINSDSSHSVSEVQIEQNANIEPAQEESLPTSTQVTITEIIDTPADNSNDIVEIKSTESSQNLVESTNNVTSVGNPEKFRTIAVESPVEETITPTSTSENLLEPNATTV